MTYSMHLTQELNSGKLTITVKREAQPFYRVDCSFNCLCKQITQAEHNMDHMSTGSHLVLIKRAFLIIRLT